MHVRRPVLHRMAGKQLRSVPCCLPLQCFRWACTVQDGWVKLVKETRDDDLAMQDLVNMLCGRRWALSGMQLTGTSVLCKCPSALAPSLTGTNAPTCAPPAAAWAGCEPQRCTEWRLCFLHTHQGLVAPASAHLQPLIQP